MNEGSEFQTDGAEHRKARTLASHSPCVIHCGLHHL